ncbi:uncharacterized protein LOC123785350 isoform X8 [Ursus americanus]|uniref:uncharacterized protein LOC123785350 isoform X8 n=1 Tax=Ursus americanus TaxID=9643 RepID=UPI001E67D79A|nr:uncharacterized protein LOC123785350 isoform X8 [Ursus americanus]
MMVRRSSHLPSGAVLEGRKGGADPDWSDESVPICHRSVFLFFWLFLSVSSPNHGLRISYLGILIFLRIGSCVYCCWEKDDIKPGKDFPGPEATTKIRSALSQDRRNNLQFSESAGLCGGHGKFLHEETEIKGSLGMNILSAVVGGIGVIILTVELAVDHGSEKRCLILRVFETVILVLSLLEVSITISLSVFGCKVTCFVTQVSGQGPREGSHLSCDTESVFPCSLSLCLFSLNNEKPKAAA